MISLYDLKQRSCCTKFTRIPYYLKNIVLLIILALILTVNYFTIVRNEEFSVETIQRFLNGLNSETFYMLIQNKRALQLTDSSVKEVNTARTNNVQFYASCVSLNRVCLLKGLMYGWPVMKKWKYWNEGYAYLEETLGDTKVTVYDAKGVSFEDGFEHQGNSFSEPTQMSYKKWLKLMTEDPLEHAMKNDFSVKDSSKLIGDVVFPEFYDSYREFKSLELTQGQYFIEQAAYQTDDRFVCAVDGKIEIQLVAHIYSKEMSAKPDGTSDLNLFKRDPGSNSKLQFINEFQHVTLNGGDCVYIPAFYFSQAEGESQNQPLKGDYKPSALMMTLKYETPQLLKSFFDALHQDLLK